MKTFCTLFDSNYISRAIAMIHSLKAHYTEDLQVIVYCMDQPSFEILSRMKLPAVVPLALDQFETLPLKQLKPQRTRAEYCWTATPIVIEDALNRFEISDITYLDADIFFFSSPDVIFKEWEASKASVMLTDHNYARPYQHFANTSGRFCVQFMGFKNDVYGRDVLTWWRDRCLESCSEKPIDGKFGDQKYLDDWPTRFQGIHVVQTLAAGVAPWNVSRFSITEGPKIDGQEIIFYHFHKLKLLSATKFDLCDASYRLDRNTRNYIYSPYLASLKQAINTLKEFGLAFSSDHQPAQSIMRSFLRKLKRKVLDQDYVVSRI